jgi:hypothetical protein
MVIGRTRELALKFPGVEDLELMRSDVDGRVTGMFSLRVATESELVTSGVPVLRVRHIRAG